MFKQKKSVEEHYKGTNPRIKPEGNSHEHMEAVMKKNAKTKALSKFKK